MVTARQFNGFAHGSLVGAAAFVDFFFTVDAHHFGGRQLGHFRAGGGFLAGVAKPAFDFDLEAAGAGEGQQDDRVDALLLGLRQAVVDRRQHIGTKRVAGEDEALGAPFLPVVLHQLGKVQGALLRAFVLPVVAQGIDADHGVADLRHFARHVAVEVTPATISGQEQGHGVLGLAGRHFNHRNLQAARGLVATDQDLAQFVVQHLRQVDVVVADAGFGVGLVAHEAGTGVIRVVVPRHQPMAVGGAFWQQVRAATLFQGQVDRDSLGLVVFLFGQPAPGEYCAGADAADQGCRAFEFSQARLQGAALQQAVLGQDHLNNLR